MNRLFSCILLPSGLLGVMPAHAAAFVQQSENSAATGASSLSAPAITVTAGDLLEVIVSGPHPDSQYGGGITLTGGTFTYACAAGNGGNFTVGAAPTGTSATLTAAWTDNSGQYPVNFSDNETRYATFANGSTTVTWANPLTGSGLSTTITVGWDQSGEIAYYEENAAGGSTTISATNSLHSDIQGIYVAEYSGIGASGSFLGCAAGLISPAGTGANGVTTDTFNAGSTPAILIGFTEGSAVTTSSGATAGTGFTLRTPVFANYQYGFPEDMVPSSGSNLAATWDGSGAQFSEFMSIALAFSATSGACTHAGWSQSGTFTVPNGTSGLYWGSTRAWVTPDCSTVPYWQQQRVFGVN